MKKLLFLLLCTVSMYGQTLQNPIYGTVKLKQNTTDSVAEKISVQSVDGSLNTISKSDLINVIEVVNYAALPTTGAIEKLYVTKDTNKLYRWNGSTYVDVAYVDISGKENTSNKSSSYAISSTTTYPNTKALVDGLATKQNSITNPITGTGTYNTLPKFTSSTTIGESTFFDQGTVSGTGLPFTSSGAITGSQFIVNGGTPTNILLAGGTTVTKESLPISTATQTALDLKAPSIGSTNYIQNGTTQQTANLNISGRGTFGKTTVSSTAEVARFNSVDTDSPYISFSKNNTVIGYIGSGYHLSNVPNNNSDFFVIRAENRLDLSIYNTIGMTLVSGGNVGIGTTTPTTKLDVAGTFKATGETTFSSSVTAASLKSTNLAGTGDSAVGTDSAGNLKRITTDSRPYKVYTALLTQTGTSAPTVIVLENTTGETPTFAYVSTGLYSLTFSQTLSKTKVYHNITTNDDSYYFTSDLGGTLPYKIFYSTKTQASNAYDDSKLVDTPIEIRIYP